MKTYKEEKSITSQSTHEVRTKLTEWVQRSSW